MVDGPVAGRFVGFVVEVDGAMGAGARAAWPRPSFAAASLPLYAGRGRGRPLGAAGTADGGAPTAAGRVSLPIADADAAPERADDMSAGFKVMSAATWGQK